MHARRLVLPRLVFPATLALLSSITIVAGCGGGEDLSPGEQDVTFTVAMAPQPPVEQRASSATTVQVQDDDTAGAPSDAEPFTAAVELRNVAPTPPGVTAEPNPNPIRPGVAATLVVRASADAQAGRHQLLIAGQISGSSTTRFFPHPVTVTATCAPATESIRHVFPSRFGRTVALTASGTLYLWGINRQPPSGATPLNNPVPETFDFFTAQRVDGRTGVISAASNEGVTAFLLGNGTLQVLSRYYRSTVGAPGGRDGWFIHSPGDTGFRQVVATADTFYLLRDDGTVMRFTSSVATNESGSFSFSTPQPVPGFADVVRLAAGGNHLLALRSDGTVLAYGTNDQGQLGDGTTLTPTAPVVVTGLTGVTDIAAGDAFSLALVNGRVVAWGRGAEGQLGNGANFNSSRPLEVLSRGGNPISSIIQVSAGASHAVALVIDGSVTAWGSGGDGQLGGGSTVVSQPFAERVPLVTADRVSAAGNSSFAVVFGSGTVRAWGQNTNGRLGDGTVTPQTEPVFALGLGRGEGVDCREPGPAPNALVFEDGDFVNSDWQAIVMAQPIDGPRTAASRETGGGNPGTYRRMTDTHGRGSFLQVFHQNLTATYDPRIQGAIDRIDYSEDRILFGELPITNDPIGADFAFRQADRIYKINQIVEVGNNSWLRYERNGLRRVDFIPISGPPCGDNEMCPNFSGTGPEIVFGYYRASATGENSSTTLFTHGIDNWRVTVHRQ